MENEKKKKGIGQSFLDIIEKLGNKLPDPIVLFMIIAGLILVASWITGMLGVSVENPADGETIEAVNLLSGEGIAMILTEAINNFGAFPPLAMVLVVMIGIGIAEKTGYFEALMKRSLEITPTALILPMVIFVGIISNVAGDAGPVILPPIAAMIFIRLGLNPIGGIFMAYAATNGAFAANFILGMTDALAVGFTEPAAQLVNPDYAGNIAMNYYYIAVSAIFLMIIIYFVAKKISIPRLGKYDGPPVDEEPLTNKEKTALMWANITAVIFVLIIAAGALLPNGILRNQETGSILQESPLMDSAVLLITVLFFIPGLVFGLLMKNIDGTKGFAKMLGDSMGSMGQYIVLVFFAAQMLAYFDWSNLGPILAVAGSDFLQSINLTGIPLFIGFILVVALINLLIGSASAKWAILAPVFIPMFMFLGYDPAFTQMLYRIGDSVTNPIAPMMPFLPLIIMYAQRYQKDIKLGTVIANLLPYSIALLIAWSIFIIIWFLIGLPVGPNGPIYLPE